MEGQALAAKLMVELCGARPVGGTIDVGGPGPAPAVVRLREARVEALLGVAIARDEQADDPRAARLRRRPGRRRPRRHRAALAAQRRHARGRPRRGGRAHLGLREAPDHAALAPRRQRAARARAAPAPPRRGRARRRRALRDPRLELRRAVARRAARDPRGRPAPPRRGLANPMSEEQSVLRTTLLGPLLDNVERNRARGHEDVRLWTYGAIYLARTTAQRATAPATAGSARASTACRPSAQHLGALLDRPAAPADAGATPSRRARTSSPPRACSAALMDGAPGAVGGRAGARAVPAPRPLRARARRRRAGGLARRAASGRRGALGPRAGRGLRARLRRARRAGRRSSPATRT